MSFPMSQEQQMLVDMVRGFCETELYPHEDLVEQLDDVPAEIAQEIQRKAIELGLYAANMPEKFGGGGLDALSFTLMERELGRAGYALHMCVGRPSNILQGCAGEQIERYLIPTIKGERHDCLAMTEPGAGSDVRSMKPVPKSGATLMLLMAPNISSAMRIRQILSFSLLQPAWKKQNAAKRR